MSDFLNFPSNPLVGQVAVLNGYSFVFNGTSWAPQNPSSHVQAASLNGGQLAGYRNLLHNPEFTVNHRGATSVSPANSVFGYPVDRWFVVGFGSSLTGSRPTLSDAERADIGEPELPGALECAATGGSAIGDFAIMGHRLDGLALTAGQWVTLTFWARRISGSGFLATEFVQSGGSGGSYQDGIGVRRHVLSSSWTRYSYSFLMPPVTDFILGSTPDVVSLFFWMSAGTNFTARTTGMGQQTMTVRIAAPQLEIGTTASRFERRSLATEVNLCQRYAISLDHHIAAQDVGYILMPFHFPVPMRYVPSAVNLATGLVINASFEGEAARDIYGGWFQAYATAPGGYIVNRRTLYTADL